MNSKYFDQLVWYFKPVLSINSVSFIVTHDIPPEKLRWHKQDKGKPLLRKTDQYLIFLKRHKRVLQFVFYLYKPIDF